MTLGSLAPLKMLALGDSRAVVWMLDSQPIRLWCSTTNVRRLPALCVLERAQDA